MTDDRARWHAARTLADLGELTAQWFEGRLRWSPAYPEPEPETRPLVPVLAAANRAGFVTAHSQPAEPRDEHGCAQRAAVSGYLGGEAFTDLMTVIAAPGAELLI